MARKQMYWKKNKRKTSVIIIDEERRGLEIRNQKKMNKLAYIYIKKILPKNTNKM